MHERSASGAGRLKTSCKLSFPDPHRKRRSHRRKKNAQLVVHVHKCHTYLGNPLILLRHSLLSHIKDFTAQLNAIQPEISDRKWVDNIIYAIRIDRATIRETRLLSWYGCEICLWFVLKWAIKRKSAPSGYFRLFIGFLGYWFLIIREGEKKP